MKILLSINPEHVENIFNGSKVFEFRRAIHKDRRVKHVVVYATKPVGKVVGEFAIAGVMDEEPSALWDQTKHQAGITRDFFDAYFHGRDRGYALRVRSPKRYPKPRDLREVLPNGIAPQSFVYLP